MKKILMPSVLLLSMLSCTKTATSPDLNDHHGFLPPPHDVKPKPTLDQFPQIKYELAPTITGYLVPTIDSNIEHEILFNSFTNKYDSLIYIHYRNFDGSWHNEAMSNSFVRIFSMELYRSKSGKIDSASRVVIGDNPTFNLGFIPTTKTDPNKVHCSRTNGFGNCYKCSRDECHDQWYCDVACGLAHAACILGWITACAILNPPVHLGGSGGGAAIDTTQLYRRFKLNRDSILLKLHP